MNVTIFDADISEIMEKMFRAGVTSFYIRRIVADFDNFSMNLPAWCETGEHAFHYVARAAWSGNEYTVISTVSEYDAASKLWLIVQNWFGLR